MHIEHNMQQTSQ